MSRAAQMLETYPGEIGFDAKALAECIASCLECAQTCTACADACLAEDRVAELRSCITHNANCADVCENVAPRSPSTMTFLPIMTLLGLRMAAFTRLISVRATSAPV